MASEETAPPEETLDPEDWASMRALGHRMVDDMIDYMQTVRKRPAWQHAPDQVKAHFRQPLPLEPQPPAEIYQEFLENVLPYPVGNIHPRFWGWVFGTGTPLGALAEFLAAAMNTNAGDLDHHSASHVEQQVIDWCKQMLGFPVAARPWPVTPGPALRYARPVSRLRRSRWCSMLQRKSIAPSRKHWNCWAWAAQPCTGCR
jgi:aromatic-L-amino-acid decarboxylase